MPIPCVGQSAWFLTDILETRHDESPHDQDAVNRDTRGLTSDGLAKSANDDDHLTKDQQKHQ